MRRSISYALMISFCVSGLVTTQTYAAELRPSEASPQSWLDKASELKIDLHSGHNPLSYFDDMEVEEEAE